MQQRKCLYLLNKVLTGSTNQKTSQLLERLSQSSFRYMIDGHFPKFYSAPLSKSVSSMSLSSSPSSWYSSSSHLLMLSAHHTSSSGIILVPSVRHYAEKSTKRTDLNYDDLCLVIESKELQLFDIREPNEITNEAAMLPNAVNIPLSVLKEALQLEPAAFEQRFGAKKPELLSKNIVFYGSGSVRSSTAVEIAHKCGFKKARHYPGGLDEWSKETGPTPKKEQTSA